MGRVFCVFLLMFGLVLLFPDGALAVCGTYFASQPQGENCIDAFTGDTIDPSVQCVAQNPGVCCSTTQECAGLGGGDEPPPNSYPDSSSNCGTWQYDPGLGQSLCFGLGGDGIIREPFQCPLQAECCRGESYCTRYYGCIYDESGNPTGECEERYTGGAGQITNDLAQCQITCRVPPPASGTAGQVQCANKPGSVNTAIGCIPYDDINNTTAFFLRWALGVGGGIALFLIAVSGIRIMTTKGDPKRLQDARDTLTAAIVGIVMIVLSVFLVRFMSETLLSLF